MPKPTPHNAVEEGTAGDDHEPQPRAGLTVKQERAIIALLNEPSVAKAAEASGVPTRTLYNWLEDPTFNKAFRKSRRETFTQAIGLTQRFTAMAVNQLAKVMNDPASPAQTKVSASTAILKFGRESIELDDLVARVEARETGTAAAARELPGVRRTRCDRDSRHPHRPRPAAAEVLVMRTHGD